MTGASGNRTSLSQSLHVKADPRKQKKRYAQCRDLQKSAGRDNDRLASEHALAAMVAASGGDPDSLLLVDLFDHL